MKDTYYKKKQGDRQADLVEKGSFVFDGAQNRGVASWKQNGVAKEGESRKVLQSCDREKNLYEPIRNAVISYVSDASISWWHMVKEGNKEVTAHTLSSQVSCFNHLFMIRNDEAAIKAILKSATGILFDEILHSFIDHDTLISFEFVYENKKLLNENHETRGANCTSVDALIYARKGEDKWLIPIEWKYTEAYDHKDKFTNFDRYEKLVGISSRLPGWLPIYSTDPFYELGRQTLLMEKIIEKHPDVANNFYHIVVIPNGNRSMISDAEAFRVSLKEDSQQFYRIISPSEFISPIETSYPDLVRYLRTRYW